MFQEVVDSMTKEPDGFGSIHDVFSSASLSLSRFFLKDVERLWLHPRWYPMWLRTLSELLYFYLLFLVNVGLRHLAIVMHLVLTSLSKKKEHKVVHSADVTTDVQHDAEEQSSRQVGAFQSGLSWRWS